MFGDTGSQAFPERQLTAYSNASSEDFVYNEYQSKDTEKKGTHHLRKAPTAHGQPETRRLMHQRGPRHGDLEARERLQKTIEEQERRAGRERSLCHVRESRSRVDQPIVQSSIRSSMQSMSSHTTHTWDVVSETESVDFGFQQPTPAKLPDSRTYIDQLNDSTGSKF